jgi:hypothetical protein
MQIFSPKISRRVTLLPACCVERSSVKLDKLLGGLELLSLLKCNVESDYFCFRDGFSSVLAIEKAVRGCTDFVN